MAVGFLSEEFKRRVLVINTELGIIQGWVEVETKDPSNTPREHMKSPRNSRPQNAPGERTSPKAWKGGRTYRGGPREQKWRAFTVLTG